MMILVAAADIRATETTALTTTTTTPALNASFTISARIDNAGIFSCWGQVVRWDKSKLRLDAQASGDFTTYVPDSRSLADINTSGEIRAGGFYQSGTSYPNNGGGSGRVAVFTFTRIANGTTSITAPARSDSDSFGWVLIAADGTLRSPSGASAVTLNDPVTVANAAPIVSAGANQTITLPNGANLAGSVSDDGLPSNVLSVTWSKVSGPGTVTFVNANATTTGATFSVAGSYVLRLTASDGALSSTADLTITVNAAATSGNGTGLMATYFDNSDFTGSSITRTDATVNFDWGNGSPDPAIGVDTFSARWEGQVQAVYSETYTFITTSDDGIRLWVNGQQIINNWTDHSPTDNSGTITLSAGQKYDVKIEFFENGGGATAKLAWSSASQARETIPAKQLFPSSVAPVPTGTGSIEREYWTGIGGNNISAIPLTTAATGIDTLTSLEGPSNWADNYGSRVRGYLVPAVGGSYTFWVATDDNGELWLSSDDQPANKVRIAYVTNWTNAREWNVEASQKSAPVTLVAGKRYYIEVLQKEGAGGDNLAVGWAKPGQATTAPSEVIPGSVLAPFPRTATATGSIEREYWTGIGGNNISAIPLTTAATGIDTLTSLEGPSNWADNYGSRVRGYLVPAVGGSYTFWLATDDNGELWLSSDDQPANKVRIAYVTNWTNAREWNVEASQKSAPVTLVAGKRYYIEVLQKEGAGGDNLAVGWAKPGQAVATPSEVIPGAVLVPFPRPAPGGSG